MVERRKFTQLLITFVFRQISIETIMPSKLLNSHMSEYYIFYGKIPCEFFVLTSLKRIYFTHMVRRAKMMDKDQREWFPNQLPFLDVTALMSESAEQLHCSVTDSEGFTRKIS